MTATQQTAVTVLLLISLACSCRALSRRPPAGAGAPTAFEAVTTSPPADELEATPDEGRPAEPPTPREVETSPAGGETGWRVELSPYVWVPGLDLDLVLGGVDLTPPGSSAGFDVFEHLDLAAMGHLDVGYGDWTLLLDGVYARFDDVLTTPIAAGDEIEGLVFEASAAYRAFDVAGDIAGNLPSRFRAEAIAGVRYVRLDVDVVLPPGGTVERNPDIVDPIIGGRLRFDLTDRWSVVVRGDVGGFGAGSHFQWNFFGGAQYHFTRRFSLGLGYRIFDMNYDEGRGARRFEFDGQLSGPLLGLTFHL